MVKIGMSRGGAKSSPSTTLLLPTAARHVTAAISSASGFSIRWPAARKSGCVWISSACSTGLTRAHSFQSALVICTTRRAATSPARLKPSSQPPRPRPELKPLNEESVIVGRFNGDWGVRGWVKVFSYTRPPEAIFDYLPWRVGSRGDAIEPVEWKKSGPRLVVRLEGVNTQIGRAHV